MKENISIIAKIFDIYGSGEFLAVRHDESSCNVYHGENQINDVKYQADNFEHHD